MKNMSKLKKLFRTPLTFFIDAVKKRIQLYGRTSNEQKVGMAQESENIDDRTKVLTLVFGLVLGSATCRHGFHKES